MSVKLQIILSGSEPELTTASEHRAAFYADLARGVATMDAACAWIRAEFDERLRADMLREQKHKWARIMRFTIEQDKITGWWWVCWDSKRVSRYGSREAALKAISQ